MIKSLEQLKSPISYSLEKWAQFLYFTKEKNYNLEHLEQLKHLNNHLVYQYVLRTFEILNRLVEEKKLDEHLLFYVEESLRWCEVAKVGSPIQRREWKKKGFDLYVHNIGSKQIYELENDYNPIVSCLIGTHGLIGQYLRGEVCFCENKPLYDLIQKNLISASELKQILVVFNQCIIEAVSPSLYLSLENKIKDVIGKIIIGDFSLDFSSISDLIERFRYLNGSLSSTSEEVLLDLFKDERIYNRIVMVFDQLQLWYYESALKGFHIDEQVKLLLLVSFFKQETDCHLTFESIMKSIYLDYQEQKMINIYKERIIENYLDNLTFEEILSENIHLNPHIQYRIQRKGKTLLFDFVFSKQSLYLIQFCETAYTSNALYQKAVFMLYDLFGFRRDKYDRFYNEVEYLNLMNASLQHKAVILDYMVGEHILDVGPGGGALMDLIEEKYPDLKVSGIDISQNVIDVLNKKKVEEFHHWNVVKGDALNLENHFSQGSIDTIIYSSIIHELFSYIDYEGKKFNHDTIAKTLTSAYRLLPVGGRIIIRDGIMSEPKEQFRIIEFFHLEDIAILDRYCHDFQGREVTYERLDSNRVKMLINDAMEFLYTYTWGENSYALEIKEQFGYFSPSEYSNFIEEVLGKTCKILINHAFLQDGYEENLLNKIAIYDENGQVVKLPDSTCIIVIEKGE